MLSPRVVQCSRLNAVGRHGRHGRRPLYHGRAGKHAAQPWTLGCRKHYLQSLKSSRQAGDASLDGLQSLSLSQVIGDDGQRVIRTCPGPAVAQATQAISALQQRLAPHHQQEASTLGQQLLAAVLHRLGSPAFGTTSGVPGAGSTPAARHSGVQARSTRPHDARTGQWSDQHDQQHSLAAAAYVLPALGKQWVTLQGLEGALEHGAVHLLREAMLVLKAAHDKDAAGNASNLVDWCLESCSPASVGLAALWGSLQRQLAGSGPSARSSGSGGFFGLLLERLHLDGVLPQPTQPQEPEVPYALATGGSRLAWRVMSSSIESVATSEAMVADPLSSSGSSSSNGSSSNGAAGLADGVVPGTKAVTNGASRKQQQQQRNGHAATAAAGLAAVPAASEQVVVGALTPEAKSTLLATLMGKDGGEEHAREAAPLEQQQPQQQQRRRAPSAPVAGAVNGPGTATPADSSSANGSSGVGGGANGSSAVASLPGNSQAQVLPPPPPPPPRRERKRAGRSMGSGSYDDEESVAASSSGSSQRPGPPQLRPIMPRPKQPQLLRPRPPRPADVSPQVDAAAPAGDAEQQPQLLPPDPFASQAFLDLERQPFRYVPLRLVPTGRNSLYDLDGAPLERGLALPRLGPLVVSNDPRAFAGTEVLLNLKSKADDKLAMRLEYITDRSAYNEVTLQLFNISRLRRLRTNNSNMYVNGQPMAIGDAGVMLQPGDEVWFGDTAFSFRVEVSDAAPGAVEQAVRQYCQATAQQEQQQQPVQAATAGQPAVTSMQQLGALMRRDAQRAEQVLRELLPAQPHNAALWLMWAQKAAREHGPPHAASKARRLFRAAVEAATAMALQPLQPAAAGHAPQPGGPSGSAASGSAAPAAPASAPAQTQRVVNSAVSSGVGSSSATPVLVHEYYERQRQQGHNYVLTQALANWAKYEWRLRCYGSARHLFRAAADEAGRHPDGFAAGGGALVLHYWATQEFEALNIRNARIIVAEALRKCPDDAALYVLAASVEYEGGHLDMAKAFCIKAYELDRNDKQLYLIWPRVEAQLGDRIRARLLYERGLEVHPMNTKIMQQFARFVAEEGAYQQARRLFDRSLSIDAASPGPGMACRCSWAALEANLGNTQLARQLLTDGLAMHPRNVQALVTLAKVERLEGQYEEGLQLLRAAQAAGGAFNEAVIKERSEVLRAMGEREMATNLSRHSAAVARLHAMKREGYWGSEAWRAFRESTKSPEQRAVVAAARARRTELGWWPAVRGQKPAPVAPAGDGRRPTTAAAQQWVTMQQMRRQREEAWRSLEEDTDVEEEAEQEEDAEEGEGEEEVVGERGGGGAAAANAPAPAAAAVPRGAPRPTPAAAPVSAPVPLRLERVSVRPPAPAPALPLPPTRLRGLPSDDDGESVGVPSLDRVRRELEDDEPSEPAMDQGSSGGHLGAADVDDGPPAGRSRGSGGSQNGHNSQRQAQRSTAPPSGSEPGTQPRILRPVGGGRQRRGADGSARPRGPAQDQ